MSETEIAYQLSLFNQKIEKNKDANMMSKLHERATLTAKNMTLRLVESSQ